MSEAAATGTAVLAWAHGDLTVTTGGVVEVALSKDRAFSKDKRRKVVSTLRRDQIVRFETRRWPDGSATLSVCVDKGGTRDYQGVHPGADLEAFTAAVGAPVVDVEVAAEPDDIAASQIAARPSEVKVVKYKNEKEYEKDARKRLASGWSIEGQSQSRGKVKIGRTVGKAVVLLPWAMMRPSRKGDPITVTWVR